MSAGPEPAAPVDLRAVVAEIEAEARRLRASGELPADLERQLDAAFARLAPVDAVGGDFRTLVAKLEDSTSFDTRAPVASATRGVAQVKTLIGRAIDWDLRHLAAQASSAAHALTRALALLGDRVEDLERDAPGAADAHLWELGLDRARPALPPGDWLPTLVAAMAGVPGPVLHAEALDGATVAALAEGGVAAYGVDPDDWDPPAGAPAVDVRTDGVRDHLRALPEGALGGVVLTGVVDRWRPGALLELVGLARTRLAPGGALVVLAHTPAAWAGAGPVADLSEGRPWAPATWVAVLDRLALRHEGTSEGDGGYAVTARRPA